MLRFVSITSNDPRAALPLIEALLREQRDEAQQLSPLLASTESIVLEPGRPLVRFQRADENGIALPDSVKEHVTVIDHKCQILIDVRPRKDELNHREATAAAKENKLGGFGDWGLAPIDDLVAIPDRKRFNPAADPHFFPHIQPRWHWASEVDPVVSDCAFGVRFGYGTVNFSYRNHTGFVLPVRSLAAPASQ